MIEDHKTQTIRYAYQRFIEFEYEQYRRLLGQEDVPEDSRKCYDGMWTRLMENGAEAFFLAEAACEEDDVDIEIANFFVWTYARDGWTTFRPYWQILRVTWRNYKAMGLDMFFENTEAYSGRKD